MRWDVVDTPPEKLALAKALVELCGLEFWGQTVLRAAARQTFGDSERWREHFPAGPRDAIWFISEVSDASMAAAFSGRPARAMAEVIFERLVQNKDLKPFVRRVMAFDVLHPIQALARMQRTSHIMLSCVASPPERVRRAAALLNLAYTAIVFVWLLDRQGEGQLTRGLTHRLMAVLRL